MSSNNLACYHIAALNSCRFTWLDFKTLPCFLGMGLEVSWLPKQEVVWLLSQQNSERKTGISIQNTNQLAGNHAFIILLTLISFQRKCPESPLSGSLPLCSSALQTIPPLCQTHKLYASKTSNTWHYYSHARIRYWGKVFYVKVWLYWLFTDRG